VDGSRARAETQHEPGGAGAVRAGDELPRIRGDYHRARPGHPHGRGAARSPQLWRDDAEGSERQTRRARPSPGDETADVSATLVYLVLSYEFRVMNWLIENS